MLFASHISYVLICCLSVQLMAMIGELFAGFENLKSLVEKLSEAFEKNSDTTAMLVRLLDVLLVYWLILSRDVYEERSKYRLHLVQLKVGVVPHAEKKHNYQCVLLVLYCTLYMLKKVLFTLNACVLNTEYFLQHGHSIRTCK